MDSKSYSDNLIECFIYIIAISVLCTCIAIFKEPFFKELTGANLVLSIITVPCCLLYYKTEKNTSLFLYMLVYTSICIESIAKWLLVINDVYVADLLLTFIFRTALLTLIIFSNCNLIKKCMKYPLVCFLSSVLIDILLIFINSYIIVYANDILPTEKIFGVLALSSYIIVFILTIQTLKQRNFILTIYNASIVILGARLLFVYIFNIFNISEKFIAEDRVFFFLAFFLLLVGLFVKMRQILTINKDLNKDVKEISENMKTIQEAEKMRSYFFANLSHEFKTPLNIISSSLQLLEQNKIRGNEYLLESYSKYESTLRQNCYRMVRLTNNFVDISKIDAGYMKLQFGNYNIVELVEDITMSVVLYIENKNINIVFDTTEEEIYVKCDPDAIERIVLNLLSNATKFTKENGNILVNISSDDEYVYIKVKDDGPGIAPELREHVFKMFVQGDKSLSRETEGSGIGLSLVNSLTKLHGGYTSIADTEIGTEIIVKIPNIRMHEVSSTDDLSSYSISSQKLIEKISIEFSDIYGIK